MESTTPTKVRRRRKQRLRQLALPFDVVSFVENVAPVVRRARRSQSVKPLVCYFGTPWLDHFDPPTGTGKGCNYCANYRGIGTETADELDAHERSQTT